VLTFWLALGGGKCYWRPPHCQIGCECASFSATLDHLEELSASLSGLMVPIRFEPDVEYAVPLFAGDTGPLIVSMIALVK